MAMQNFSVKRCVKLAFWCVNQLGKIGCQSLHGILFVGIRDVAVNLCRDVYVAVSHEAARIQKRHPLPRQYRAECVAQAVDRAPFFNAELIT